MFPRGFDSDHLIWLPYDEDAEDGLTIPVSFRFESGCSDEAATTIFNCIIRPYVLPANFRHDRGKIQNDPNLIPTYEFYNPCFVARQLGLGQLRYN